MQYQTMERRVLKQPQLGKKLKTRRYRLNLSLSQLMRESGVSVATICALENGKRHNPQMVTLERILRALDTNMKFVES